MRKALAGIILFFLIFSMRNEAFGQQPQQAFTSPVESGELITPVNVKPLSIETVTRRRGIVVGAAAKNLIILSCSGLSGATAAFFEFYSQRRRDLAQWQGFQLVFPPWSSEKEEDLDLIGSFSRHGKRIGLISDMEFSVPPFIYGFSDEQKAVLEQFHLALTFSDDEKVENRRQMFAMPAISGIPVAYDLSSLGEHLRNKSGRFFASIYSTAGSCPVPGKREQPWVPELTTSLIDRMAFNPEGFCLVINYSGVSAARNKGNFYRMLEHMKVQEALLQQLNVFVQGRKDTLLLVVDEPENGIWKTKPDFSVAGFVGDLALVPQAVDIALKDGEIDTDQIEKLLKVEFDKKSLLEAIKVRDKTSVISVFEQAIARKHDTSFVAAGKSGFNSGLTVLAQGLNADIFFGMGSYTQFSRRVRAAFGVK